MWPAFYVGGAAMSSYSWRLLPQSKGGGKQLAEDTHHANTRNEEPDWEACRGRSDLEWGFSLQDLHMSHFKLPNECIEEPNITKLHATNVTTPNDCQVIVSVSFACKTSYAIEYRWRILL